MSLAHVLLRTNQHSTALLDCVWQRKTTHTERPHTLDAVARVSSTTSAAAAQLSTESAQSFVAVAVATVEQFLRNSAPSSIPSRLYALTVHCTFRSVHAVVRFSSIHRAHQLSHLLGMPVSFWPPLTHRSLTPHGSPFVSGAPTYGAWLRCVHSVQTKTHLLLWLRQCSRTAQQMLLLLLPLWSTKRMRPFV